MYVDRSATRPGPADWFTGTVWMEEIAAGAPPSRVRASNVRFAPGARTAWHSHPLGQVLHITEGVGRVQCAGGAVTEVRAGDTVHIAPDESHWHGAAPDAFMTHVAIQGAAPDGTAATWGRHVGDAEYTGETPVREHLATADLGGAARVDRVETHRITLAPGQVAGRHTHPGGVAGYVTAGRVAFQLEGGAVDELRAGSAFVEPPGAVVLRFDNLEPDRPATFVACYPVTGGEPLLRPL
jgi:quercetin dioxygenase-like cupin family protein